ncbi:uncharacterized protein LOC108115105 [Drosophila eugracilis]|uniref:uncharacterized protein LOC108115105 n=1 Tax=Drosophila eugracilis TaxID=29029 RepID=UPI0007E797BF|nr:uncharacterized protein LOC108115105 [Drosophila eugracilis]
MEDPRKRELDKLITSFLYLKETKMFHIRQIKYENMCLYQSVVNKEMNHKKIDHLGKISDYKNLLKETQRKMKKMQSTIQKFQELNSELKDTMGFQLATKLIEENTAMEENLLNADTEEMLSNLEDLKIAEQSSPS